MAARSYTVLCMCALWPWSWRYDLGSRSWHIIGSWTTIVWNIIQIQFGSEELWPGQGFLVCMYCDLEIRDITLGQGHDTPLGHGIMMWNIIQIQFGRGFMLRTQNFGICALWPWPWRYDLVSRSWHIFLSWTTIVWNIIQIQLGSEELWPRHRF